MTENEITEIIVDKCIKIHTRLGPGLLESVYEEVLFYELINSKLECERQVNIPIIYDDIIFNLGYRLDIIVDDKVIIELKSTEHVLPVHKKQLLTYLKVTGKKVGLLINFNEDLIKNGIIRIVNNF
ncbi:MAG TPA: GxxExxY protein [Spirochaetota bacterium]|nr:GxxExxY protein [Spirochaetota bacterium]